MNPFDFRPRTRILFGAGEFTRLGEVARELGGNRCLLVADPQMAERGQVREALRSLKARRMEAFAFSEMDGRATVDLTADTVEAARVFAAPLNPDLVVGLGSSAALHCAQAVNLLLTNSGSIRDYWGYGKAAKPLLPMIAVPAPAGAGAEALSHVLIRDAETSSLVFCGDARLVFRAAILDPRLSLQASRDGAAAGGYHAISNAVESLLSTRRTAISECFAREALRLLNGNFERVVRDSDDLDARGAMLLGAHLAGAAVEQSTLGPANACAFPLTAHYGLAQGVAMAVILAPAVEWSGQRGDFYPGNLAARLRDLAEAGRLPRTLRDAGVREEALPGLAEEAAAQWSGRFSERDFDAGAAREIYRLAY